MQPFDGLAMAQVIPCASRPTRCLHTTRPGLCFAHGVDAAVPSREVVVVNGAPSCVTSVLYVVEMVTLTPRSISSASPANRTVLWFVFGNLGVTMDCQLFCPTLNVLQSLLLMAAAYLNASYVLRGREVEGALSILEALISLGG